MRDWGELRALAIRRWTGNWQLDSRGIMPEELECYRAAHDAESQRRYELKERALRVTNRNQPS